MRAAGEVTRADVLMKPSGLSKGCGIVEFATPAQAQAAIRTLNDSMLLDRQIIVREVRASGFLAPTGVLCAVFCCF
jgi:RNA recognition motif-containing protein